MDMEEFKSGSLPSEQPMADSSEADPANTEGPVIQSIENVDVKSKPKRTRLIILIILLLIIFIPAGLIVATELGYLNIGLHKYYNAIGLEKYWRGLPVSPDKALPVITAKMDEVNSFHFEGLLNFNGEISGDIPQISYFVKRQTGQVLGNSSEKIEASVGLAGDYQKPQDLKTTLSLRFGDDLASLGSSLGLGSNLNIDIISVDNKVYFKIPALSLLTGTEHNKWLEMDVGMYYNTPNQETFDLYIMQSIEDGMSGQPIKSSQRKFKKIDGKYVYQYQIIIDKDKLKTQYPEIGFVTEPVLTFNVGLWDHLLYQVMVKGDFQYQGYKSNLDFDIKFSNFNKSIQIEAPAENEIEKEGLLKVLEPLIGPISGTDNVNANDAKRKSDLASLGSALELYNDDNGQYPKTDGVIKINDENSSIYQAIVPEYLSDTPKDPKDPEFYYAYQSDGNSYQLSCVLENKSDPDGQQVGNLYLYIKKSE